MEKAMIRKKMIENWMRGKTFVYYVYREDECICLDYAKGERVWNTAILPHPDVTLQEFFN